jgi:hypothetical protein
MGGSECMSKRVRREVQSGDEIKSCIGIEHDGDNFNSTIHHPISSVVSYGPNLDLPRLISSWTG